ncbi:hypothetical protein ULMS_28910 [Patiriisocius marinistellae]|uniref:DUF6089 domain-containing protein n=1 Tax=Patiriisocius marinistellae TaxID=2494560 RepID=A0A5J4FZ60_9FLAO|nr:DUF6089 family protein [Patiriisocius marinistellae]GEQ87383.1 hypothetical protein ULMS_28910 [Patiriisocius marinistellae]
MRYITPLILLFTCSFLAHSQTYEIGGFVGGANVIGDVGNTAYINPNALAVGAIFKWNRSERHSFRFSATYAKAEGDDLDSDEERRQQRGYSFQNNIKEASLGMEYTFWEFNLNTGNPASAPYLYTGITYFLYEASYIRANGTYRDYDQAGSFAIPMTLGYKATISTKLIAAIEIGARYTFTDDLDGSYPVKGLADSEGFRFGNVNNNDWYVFTGFTLSFTFGREPCYCNF